MVDDGRTPEHGYTISSQLKKRHQTMTKANFEIGPPVLEKIFEEFLPYMGLAAILVM